MATKRARSRGKLSTLRLTSNQCIDTLRALRLAVEHLQATAKPNERAAVAMECADYKMLDRLVEEAMLKRGFVTPASSPKRVGTEPTRGEEPNGD